MLSPFAAPLILLAHLPLVPQGTPPTPALHVVITPTHVMVDSYPLLGFDGALHLVDRPTDEWRSGDALWPMAQRLMQQVQTDARMREVKANRRVALFVDALVPIRTIRSTLSVLEHAEFGPFEAVVDTPSGRARLPFGTSAWGCTHADDQHPSQQGMLDWSQDPDDPLSGFALDLLFHRGPPRPCHAVQLRLVDGGWQAVSDERWVRDRCAQLTDPTDAPRWPQLDNIALPPGELCETATLETQPDALWGTVLAGLGWLHARGVAANMLWWLDATGQPRVIWR